MPSAFPEAKTSYTSFDGHTRLFSRSRRPDRYRYWDLADLDEVTIPRGAGLSYVAASFSARSVTVDHGRFNRILAFDGKTRQVEVEAGISLGDLYDFLSPRGFYLSAQPGHPAITVGGCCAPDVHGKNQFREGTFIRQVEGARLFHPAHGIIEIGPRRSPELFRLTFGGYGLTGNLVSVTLGVKEIPSPIMSVRTLYLDDIHQLPAQLGESAARSDLVYSWHSFTAKGRSFGRGFIKEGRFDVASGYSAPSKAVAGPATHRPLSSESRGSWRVPLLGSVTIPLCNRLYDLGSRAARREGRMGLYEFLFPVHEKQFYFKLFGRRGFWEYQVLIPAHRFDEWVDRVRVRLSRKPIPVTLASGKLFAGEGELLRFTGNGICFALDFPRTPEGREFAEYLDRLSIQLGCLPNLIKDSRLSARVVAETYPGYERFRRELREFDPRRLYRSELSDRLEL